MNLCFFADAMPKFVSAFAIASAFSPIDIVPLMIAWRTPIWYARYVPARTRVALSFIHCSMERSAYFPFASQFFSATFARRYVVPFSVRTSYFFSISSMNFSYAGEDAPGASWKISVRIFSRLFSTPLV